jgi:transcriptional regulator with XRE-family HTH domain
VGQVVLGKRLQELREAAGIGRDEAARVLRVAPATVRRMETADVALKIPYVQILLTAYGVAEDEVTAFVELAEEANRPGWWQRFHDVLPEWFSLYVSLEGAARIIRSYEPHFVRCWRPAPSRTRDRRPWSGTCRCAWSGSGSWSARTRRTCG